MADVKKPTPVPAATPAGPKPKHYDVKLVSPGAELRFIAKEKNGKFSSYGFHTLRGSDGKRATGGQGRGATTQHPTFEKAVGAVNAAAEIAVSKGWIKKTRGGARVDSFNLDTLPVPASAPVSAPAAVAAA